MKNKKDYYKQRYQEIKNSHKKWHTAWDVCYYFSAMIENYSSSDETSPDLKLENFDSYAINAVEKLAGVLKGMIFPSAKQSYKLATQTKFKDQAAIVGDVSKMSQRLIDLMDAPESKLENVFYETLQDLIIGGTGGVEPKLNKNTRGLFYKGHGPSNVMIDTDENGEVNTVYIASKMSLRNIISVYGESNLSQELKDAVKENKLDDKHTIVWAVEPNQFRDKTKKDNKNFAFSSDHFVESDCHVLKESGFHELPVKVGRLKVRNKEKYGRSFVMSSINDIKNLNKAGSIIMVGSEFKANPMLGYYEGALGTDTIHTKAGEWVPIDSTKVDGNRNPVFPIFEVGDLDVMRQMYIEFKNELAENFQLDRLLDFNNQTQMTAQEARLRSAIKNQSSNGIYSRIISELVTPVIVRSFNLAYDNGLLGCGKGSPEEKKFKELFPDKTPEYLTEETYNALKKGEDIYYIDFLTEAARIMKSDKKQALLSFISFLTQVAQVWPQGLSILKGDETLRYIAEQEGIDESLIRTMKEMEVIRQQEQKAAQQQAMLQQRQQQAEVAKVESEVEQA